MSNYYIVEAHTHAFPSREIGLQAKQGRGLPDYAGTAEDILTVMKKSGIAQAVMLNMLPSGDMREAHRARIPKDSTPAQRQEAERQFEKVLLGRYQRRNQWICQVGQEHPNLAPLLTVDPGLGLPAIREELEGGARKGARGIKLHPSAQHFYPSQENLWPIYEMAQELGLPIIFDSGKFELSSVQYGEPERFAGMLARFPKLAVILAHLGRGFYPQTRELAPQHRNLYFDCSVVVTEGEATISDAELVSLIRHVGADRVMFGSDFPWHDPALGIQHLLRLPLSEEEKRLILGENALRIYKLPRR